MKILGKLLSSLLCLFLVFWIGTLIKCDVLTLLHHNEFKNIYTEKYGLETDYFKVLEYQDDYARVYYVTVGNTLGEVLTLKKNNGNWVVSSCKTIWSGTGGSASEVIWPYWWHFIYGGF